MPYNVGTKLDDAIKKYAGDDQVKHQALKETVRDYLGYSNFVGRMNKTADAPMNINLRGNITPAGVQTLVGGGMDMQKTEINYLKQLGKGVNVAADQLATEKAKKDKAAKEKAVKFAQSAPRDWVESEFKNWMTNPYNPDGTAKTYEQFHKEITDRITGEGDMPMGGTEELDKAGKAIPGTGKPYSTSTDIDSTINKLMQGWDTWREDYAEDPKKQSYLAMGYTEAEATDLVNYDRYATGKMGEAEAQIYQLKSPTWAKNAEIVKQEPNLIRDITPIQVNGQLTIPKTFEELKQTYQNVDETTLKEMVAPSYKMLVQDDVRQFLQENSGLADPQTGAVMPGYAELLARGQTNIRNLMTTDDGIGNLEFELAQTYGDVLLPKDIKSIIYQMLTQ